MRKKKVLSHRELETEKILQTELPEYVIRANVRLADVIHAGNQFEYMSGYHLDFIICDNYADTIAAIELDDSYHDTEDGKRKDTNKNRWLEEARIPLIRLREPKEALTIRKKLGLPDNSEILHENIPIFMKPKQKNQISRYIGSLIATIAIAWLLMWTLSSVAQKTLSNIGKNAVAQQQRIQQENEQWTNQQNAAQQKTQAEAAWQKQQEIEQVETRQKVTAQQPHYERVLIKGKPARECANGNVITNETILCTKDHYETVLINGTQ